LTEEPVAPPVVPAPRPAPVTAQPAPAVVTEPMVPPVANPVPPPEPVIEISHLAVIAEKQGAALQLALAKPVEYSVRATAGGGELVLKDARFVEGHTQRFESRVVREIAVNAEGADLRITFALERGASLGAAEIVADPEAGYVLSVHSRLPRRERAERREAKPEPPRAAEVRAEPAASTVAVAPPSPPAEMKAATAAPEPRDPYREGLAALNKGDRAQALALFMEVVAVDESRADARQAAAGLMMEDGAKAEAAAVLERGLQLSPADHRLTGLYGRLLADRGDLDGALAALGRAAPPVAVDPEYHALTGALAQRAGRHADAIAAYRRCLTVNPGRGVWWLGLGISLAASGDNSGAVAAYERAVGDGALASRLRDFAQTQIRVLKGGQG